MKEIEEKKLQVGWEGENKRKKWVGPRREGTKKKRGWAGKEEKIKRKKKTEN
jgi:hypothetical protein